TDSGSDTNNEETTGPQDGGDLITAVNGQPTNFNAYYYSDTASGDIAGLMFNGLIKVNKEIAPEGDLAKDWEISDDGLTYTFHLRKGVKFHDGKPMTSADVKFSYNIPRSEDYTGPRASSFSVIKSIETPDDYTVKISLKNKYAPFLLETATYPILPKHLLKDVPIKDMEKAEFNTSNPVGTGPYKFVEWKKGQYVKVKANENYFAGRPHIDTITVKAVSDANSRMAQFQAGQINFMWGETTQAKTINALEDQGKAKVKRTLGLNYDYIGWNQKNPLFQSKTVRQALTHAINRKGILKAAVNGEGKIANTPGSPLQKWSYNPDVPVFAYNPEKAKKMLASEGWKDHNGDGTIDKNGKEFKFTILSNKGNQRRKTIGEIVQQNLKKVGIDAQPKLMEWSAELEKINPPNWDYDAVILGWALGADPDPKQIFSATEIKKGLNFVWYKPDQKIEKLMQENSKVTDREKRGEMIKEIQAAIAEDQPYTFLYYKNNIMVYTPKLHAQQGIDTSFYHVKDWWIEQ
ncbi:MAG TPA: peptide-binding protein, partial [Bacillales bacterium]|nr:peptide-binding protein [Bacillales bacterium]